MLTDSHDDDISIHIAKCNDFIDAARAESGKVLVHCFQGKSRSVSICCAYLMFKMKLTFQNALTMIQSTRVQAMPNSTYRNQIIKYFSSE
jgi:protein-tyrosine phosphatase